MLEPALAKLLDSLQRTESAVNHQHIEASMVESAKAGDPYVREIVPGNSAGSDIPYQKPDTAPMTDTSDYRHELQLRDEQLRREMRLRERSSRREAVAHNAALKAHIESNDKAVAITLDALERTEKEFGTVKQANKEQRYWMAGIGVAIVLGIMGANATIFGGGKTFFDGGKESVLSQQRAEQLIQDAKSQSDATSALLKQMQARQEELAAPSQAKP